MLDKIFMKSQKKCARAVHLTLLLPFVLFKNVWILQVWRSVIFTIETIQR